MAKDVLNKNKLPDYAENVISAVLNGKEVKENKSSKLYNKINNCINLDRLVLSGLYNLTAEVITIIVLQCTTREVGFVIFYVHSELLCFLIRFLLGWAIAYIITKVSMDDTRVKIELKNWKELFGV
jgi:hypothetical protein